MKNSRALRREAQRILRTAANLTSAKIAASLRAVAAKQIAQADAQDLLQAKKSDEGSDTHSLIRSRSC
jgi:hypothetical protein